VGCVLVEVLSLCDVANDNDNKDDSDMYTVDADAGDICRLVTMDAHHQSSYQERQYTGHAASHDLMTVSAENNVV